MADRSFLAWPFFDDGHRALAERLERWAAESCPSLTAHDEEDSDAVYRCVRGLVAALGEAGLLQVCVPRPYGGASDGLDIALPDPSASSRHASIYADPSTGQAYVEDDGSRNGTFLNEQRLSQGERRQLRDH